MLSSSSTSESPRRRNETTTIPSIPVSFTLGHPPIVDDETTVTTAPPSTTTETTTVHDRSDDRVDHNNVTTEPTNENEKKEEEEEEDEDEDEIAVTFAPTTSWMIPDSPVRPEFCSARPPSVVSITDIPFPLSRDDPFPTNIGHNNMRYYNYNNTMAAVVMNHPPHHYPQRSYRHDGHPDASSHVVVTPTEVTIHGTTTTGPNSPTTTSDDNNNNNSAAVPQPRTTRLRYVRRVAYCSLRFLCFPVWLLVSVFTVSSVIAFCILPGFVLICIMISCYYCCSRDPIPFHVLMQALLMDDVNNNSAENTNAPSRTKEEIRELLICRTCEQSESRPSATTLALNDDNDDVTSRTRMNNHQPDHEEIASRGPICIATDHYLLTFSNVIETSPNSEDDNDDLWEQLPALQLSTTENDRTSSSVGAVQALSTDSHDVDEDDINVLADRHHTASIVEQGRDVDIEQGRDSFIEMASMSRAATIEALSDQLDSITFTELKNKEKMLDVASSHNADDDDYFENGIGCDICLRRYQKDDIVAWSYNEACVHAYHLHCITDWLQKKITCPNCRCHYIPKYTNQQKRNAPPDTTTGTARTRSHNNTFNTGRNSSTAEPTSAILQYQRSVEAVGFHH